eukprot:COSAG01_NODE_3118_length_6562_cov_343.759554_4_plen_642_part_00
MATSDSTQLSEGEQYYMRANKLYEAIAKVLHQVLRVRYTTVYKTPWVEPAGEHEDFLIGRTILHGSADATCLPIDRLGGDITAEVRGDGFVVLSGSKWTRVRDRWRLKLTGKNDGVAVQGTVRRYKPKASQPQVMRGFRFFCDIHKGAGLLDCACGLGGGQECEMLVQSIPPLGDESKFRDGLQARLKLLNEGSFAGRGISCMDITGMHNLLIDPGHQFLADVSCSRTSAALENVNDTRNQAGMHLFPHAVAEDQFKNISDTMEAFVQACKDDGILDGTSKTVQDFGQSFKQYVTEESMFVKWTKADYEAALLSHYGDRVHFRRTKSQEWNSKPIAMFETMVREAWETEDDVEDLAKMLAEMLENRKSPGSIAADKFTDFLIWVDGRTPAHSPHQLEEKVKSQLRFAIRAGLMQTNCFHGFDMPQTDMLTGQNLRPRQYGIAFRNAKGSPGEYKLGYRESSTGASAFVTFKADVDNGRLQSTTQDEHVVWEGETWDNAKQWVEETYCCGVQLEPMALMTTADARPGRVQLAVNTGQVLAISTPNMLSSSSIAYPELSNFLEAADPILTRPQILSSKHICLRHIEAMKTVGLHQACSDRKPELGLHLLLELVWRMRRSTTVDPYQEISKFICRNAPWRFPVF